MPTSASANQPLTSFLSATIEEVIQASHLLWQIGLNTFWWSTPGCGKTQSHLAIARELKLTLEIVVGSAKLPEDISGYPYPDMVNGLMRRFSETWVKRLLDAKNSGAQCLMLLDDFSVVTEAMETVFYGVVQEKQCGEDNLEGVWMSACGNPPGTAAGARPLSLAMANRFCHFELPFNAARWAKRRRLGFPLPELRKLNNDWELNVPRWNAAIGTYCERNSSGVNDLNKNAGKSKDGNILGYPSERSLDNLGLALAACDVHFKGTEDYSAIQRLIGIGLVGEGFWQLFSTFIRDLDLPDPEDYLDRAANNQAIKFSERADIIYVALGGVVEAIVRNNTHDRWRNALRVLDKAPKDVAAVSFEELYKKMPKGYILAQDPLAMSMVAEFNRLQGGK